MRSPAFRSVLLCLLLFAVVPISAASALQGAGQFSVIGEANKPGVFDLQEGLTIRRALALFDGVTEKASLSRIVISRRTADGTRTRIPIDLEGILSGTKADIPVVADDIIIIPEFGVNKIP